MIATIYYAPLQPNHQAQQTKMQPSAVLTDILSRHNIYDMKWCEEVNNLVSNFFMKDGVVDLDSLAECAFTETPYDINSFDEVYMIGYIISTYFEPSMVYVRDFLRDMAVKMNDYKRFKSLVYGFDLVPYRKNGMLFFRKFTKH